MSAGKSPLLFPQQRYSCIHCGKSCGNWRIWVEEELLDSLRQQPLARQLEAGGIAYLRLEENGQHSLDYDQQGRCRFFDGQQMRCGLHAESGWLAKPRTCRQFPFFLLETPDGLQVGLSFRCGAVQQDVGVEWEEHRADLEQLASSGNYPRVGFEAAELGHYRLNWPTYLSWEREWLGQLQNGEGLLPGVWQKLYHHLPLPLEQSEFSRLIDNFARQLSVYLELPLVPPDPYVARYLGHLLERKWLWAGPHWLGRLLALLVAEVWLAQHRVDDVEGQWMSHRSDLDPVHAHLAGSLLQMV